jgi:hypothetical protein
MKTSILFLCLIVLVGCSTTQLAEVAPQPDDDAATSWIMSTGRDDYARILGLRTNQFGGVYAEDQPIPVSVEIRNYGPVDPDGPHPEAQLFPHLDAWIEVEGLRYHRTIPLGIKNRLWIKKGETFVKLIDLNEVLKLEASREYQISVGHLGGFVSDLGDWLGTLRSPDFTVVITPAVPGGPE